MRHPSIWHDSKGEMMIEVPLVEQLAGLAETSARTSREVFEEPASSMEDAWRDVGYAEGVAAALGWLAGNHADDKLTELLDIDEEQR